MLINRITQTLVTPPVPPVICIFVGTLDEVDTVTSELVPNLPPVFSTVIDIQPIDNSTLYLQASRNCRVFYTQSCFKVITPEEFINTHYDWLYRQVTKWYDKQPSICRVFSVDDAFQELFFYLDRVLSKYNNQCNLRTFVANRLRWYFEQVVRRELTLRLKELSHTLSVGQVEPPAQQSTL